MPHLLHHRRRHSWPYCGPIARSGTASSAPIKLARPPQVHPQYTVPLQPADILLSEEQYNDAASAGIIRSKTKMKNRLWSTPTSTVRNPKSQVPILNVGGGGGSGIPVPAFMPTILPRQIVRPQLDRARSLFALPTVAATTGASIPGTGTNMASHWVPITAVPTQQPLLTPNSAKYRIAGVDGQHGAMLRRCHSERPRSWREPSAGLYTLVEE